MMNTYYVALFVGGGLGTLCRFWVSKSLSPYLVFPLGTLASNILASLIMGFFLGYWAKADGGVPYLLRLWVAVGFCGGFSTFSAYSFEVFQMLQQGRWGTAAVYVMMSTAFCVLSTALAWWIAQSVS